MKHPKRSMACALVALALAVSGCGYNSIQGADENVKAAWAEVQNQYQRRMDLIPNLVSTVKGAANFEKETLEAVIQARASATSVKMDATPTQALRPGEFIWEGGVAPEGPVVVVVSLPEQMAYVYRNGVRIGVTTASTGKAGHGTPTGVFTIPNKDKDHHSKTYGNAPMPYSERLTMDGVALHAGGLPGYPSSHGCVHLPSEFARLLFGIT